MSPLDKNLDAGNAFGVEIVVSIPDDVFADAESLAKQLKASRSEIYSRALAEFLGRHAPDRVTEKMNQLMEAIGDAPDPFSKRAARHVLRRVE